MATPLRTLFRSSAFVLVGLSVVSCATLKKKILGEDLDASAEAGVVAESDASVIPVEPAPLAAIGATNEDDVARFPDEERLANVSATLLRATQAREVPSLGGVVANLAKGTVVTQISQRDGKYFLVTFPNPKAPTTTLMGWVHADTFVAPGVAVDAGPAKPLTCTAPLVAVLTDVPTCARICTKDGDCAAGETCHGSGQRMKDGKPGDGVTICSMVVHKDAGAPAAPTDAGAKPATADAGAAPAATVDAGAKPATIVLDAGAKPAAAAAATTEVDVVAPAGGACAVGFMLVKKDNKCHRLCPTFGECKQKETRNCIGCDGNKVCSADRELCK